MMRDATPALYGVLGIMLAVPMCLGAAEKQPNILLILADDVGSDALGCYGGQSYPTLHIDALAQGGMKFNHAYAMPVCHPSRICLMTGRYPFRFGKAGSQWGGFPDSAESITIGHRMKQGGYATAVAGKWQLCLMKDDRDHPKRVGFDEWCLFGWHEGGRYHDPLLYQNGSLRDDTGTRVPLIANWPGRIEPGQEVEEMVDLTDYLPTLADVAGLDDDGVPRDGVSFAPILLGSPEPRQPRPWVFIEHGGKRCVRSADWKLYDDGRFFDLKRDPGESSPLDKGQLTGEAGRHYMELTKVLIRLEGPLPGSRSTRQATRPDR